MHFAFVIAHSCGIVAQNCIGSPLSLPKSVLGGYESKAVLADGHAHFRYYSTKAAAYADYCHTCDYGVSCSRFEEIVLETELLELKHLRS